MDFDRSVFVNCPFDEAYLPLLRPLLFTIRYVGFFPRIALESLDSGAPRIEKIVRLIGSSRYAIHDLSRLKAKEAGEYYRLNMPFELGIDVGCRIFGKRNHKRKAILILETERYRYQAALSDMSNSDIGVHGGVPERVVAETRNWLVNQTKMEAPGPSTIWGAFLEFMTDNDSRLRLRGFSDGDIANLPVSELMTAMDMWLKAYRG